MVAKYWALIAKNFTATAHDTANCRQHFQEGCKKAASREEKMFPR